MEKTRGQILKEKFDLKPSHQRTPLPGYTRILLEEHLDRHKDILQKGSNSLRFENRTFGGSALPNEPGGKHFFKKI